MSCQDPGALWDSVSFCSFGQWRKHRSEFSSVFVFISVTAVGISVFIYIHSTVLQKHKPVQLRFSSYSSWMCSFCGSFSDWFIRFMYVNCSRQPQTIIYCLSWPGNLCSCVVLRYRATAKLSKPAGGHFFFVMLTIQDYMGYDYLNVNETILYIFHPTNSNHPRRAWQGLIAGNP